MSKGSEILTKNKRSRAQEDEIPKSVLNSLEQNWIEEFKNDIICYVQEKHKTNNLLPYNFASDILINLQVIYREENRNV